MHKLRTGADPARIQLPLDIMSSIISHIKSPSDLASVARTSRIHHFLSIPLLYHTVSLRRPSRRPRAGKKYMALSALMKPGIAACVKVLEIVGEDEEERDRDAEDEWWERAQWSDEDTVWAVAVAGVLAGCTRLETFWWKTDDYVHPLLFTALVRNPSLKELKISHPAIPPYHPHPSTNGKTGAGKSLAHKGFSNNPSIHRPPLTSVPPFRTLRRLCLTNLPSVSAFIDDYSPAIFFSPTLESISLSWRDPTPLGRMLFLQRILQQKKPPTARGVGIGVGTGRPSDRQTAGKLRLKELELRNVIFDFPMVGDIKEWLDMAQLEKLSLLDCEVVDAASWLELIGAGSHGSLIESEQPPGFLSGGGFTVGVESPGAASSVVSTPGTTPGSTASVIRVVQLKLKSLRINSCAAHWALLLNSFDGLEELYILDPPAVAHDEAENATVFLEAIERHHGATLKRLRLCSRWSYERLDVSRLFRSCAGLEELAISMLHSQWKILDVLIVFLTRLRYIHVLTVAPLTRADVMAEMRQNAAMMEIRLAQQDLRNLEVFAFGDFGHRADRVPVWDEARGRWVRKGRFVELADVWEWAGIWRAERVE
ncbi:uncharacterized protein LAJ45_07590 [Morchella importuna]|uniref:uncharacterized protein n=1 Tax=Morchella importuna TaxID=1174673 RepID=UPI001E8DCD1D|nr:uncharacterized protein LAJ45_07590 [Morchella importuna]KAH8148487.1 hypothetical protein LAJ45_07590 [Morchella importuna]